MADDKLYGNVLIKAIAILDYLKNNDKAPMLNDIAKELGISKGTASKIMHTMKELDLAIQDPLTSRYAIGVRLIGYGQKALAQVNIENLLMPYLEDLHNRFEETIHLGVEYHDNITYIYKKEAKQVVMLRSRVGDNLNIATSAMGKAVLATKSNQALDLFIKEHPLTKITEHTIVDETLFKEEIARVRANGYALDDEENEIGVCCMGVCFVSNDKVLGAMSISVPTYRLTPDKKDSIIEALLKVKQEVEAKI